jgi:hypothetical protein
MTSAMSAATAAAVGPEPAPGPWMKMRPIRVPSMNRALVAPRVSASGWPKATRLGWTRTATPSSVRSVEAIRRMR